MGIPKKTNLKSFFDFRLCSQRRGTQKRPLPETGMSIQANDHKAENVILPRRVIRRYDATVAIVLLNAGKRLNILSESFSTGCLNIHSEECYLLKRCDDRRDSWRK